MSSSTSQQLFSLLTSIDPIARKIPEQFLKDWNVKLEFKRGERLNHVANGTQFMWYVEKGKFKIGLEFETQERVVGFGYEHSLLADLPSILGSSEIGYYIECTERATLIGISKTNLENWKRNDKHVLQIWCKMIEQALLGRLIREKELMLFTPVEKLKKLLNRSPHIFQFFSQKDIASYLNVTPETLSRAKRAILD